MSLSRKFIVGGNFKLNGSLGFLQSHLGLLSSSSLPLSSVEVVIAPPSVYLTTARDLVKGTGIQVSAQNVSEQKDGAFTGEVSCGMLLDLGIHWTIIGHSERRNVYGESDETVGKKAAAALKAGLSVILCIGEKREERDAGRTNEVNFRQLEAYRAAINDEAAWAKVVIAYEPVWSIGTGLTASPEQAQEAHRDIRKWLADHISPAVAQATRIQYGGSVNAANCKKLAEQPDIDGFLVGGASLKPEFVDIVKAKN
jgi:triosephosphate isomerase